MSKMKEMKNFSFAIGKTHPNGHLLKINKGHVFNGPNNKCKNDWAHLY